MTDELPHLHQSIRQYAYVSEPERIRFVHSEHWINHQQAQWVLDRLEHLLAYPTRARMPCLLLHGDSGMGKTMIIEKFMRAHPEIYDKKSGVHRPQLIAMQMPPAPSERRFYSKLLQAMGAPDVPNETLEMKESIALRLLKRIQPRMLIIDEVHHLLAGTAREQRRALNLLKFLANELRIPIVTVGVNEALHVMQSEEQIASRFEPFLLARWQENEELRRLLAAFAQRLPLRRPSNLIDRDIVRLILKRTEGITGRIASLLANAAVHAILKQHETIDESMLALAANPPSQRSYNALGSLQEAPLPI